MSDTPEQHAAPPQPFVPPVAPPPIAAPLAAPAHPVHPPAQAYPQQAYPQQEYPQQLYAPQAYPQPYPAAGGFGWAAAPEPARSRALGIVSMALALVVFLLSVVASIIVGSAAGPLAQRSADSFSFDSGSLSPEQAESFAPVAVLMGAQMLFGTVLGLVALVLGIVAAATKRGRAFGVVGIVAAAAAPIVSFIVYTAVLAVSAPGL